MRVNVPRLVTAYYAQRPDPSVLQQRVQFGTSGHRGCAFARTFNESHILSIAQAICDYRTQQKAAGPLFLAIDTHALSVPAFATTLEVFAANEVEATIAGKDGYTPVPAISHAILTHNRGRTSGLADGVVITPSHNPPENGARIDDVKVEAESAWFAARPSGTEDVYKIYAESFRSADHLRLVLEEEQAFVDDALRDIAEKDRKG